MLAVFKAPRYCRRNALSTHITLEFDVALCSIIDQGTVQAISIQLSAKALTPRWSCKASGVGDHSVGEQCAASVHPCSKQQQSHAAKLRTSHAKEPFHVHIFASLEKSRGLRLVEMLRNSGMQSSTAAYSGALFSFEIQQRHHRSHGRHGATRSCAGRAVTLLQVRKETCSSSRARAVSNEHVVRRTQAA